MTRFSESVVEDAALDWFEGLGSAGHHCLDTGDMSGTTIDEVCILARFRVAARRFTATLPMGARK